MKDHELNCPYRKRCGGCDYISMDYKEQLAHKQKAAGKLLQPFGKVEPIIGMENPWHYRNKVQAAFGLDRNRHVISGVYQSSSRRIVPVDSCRIEDPAADAIIVTIRKLLPSQTSAIVFCKLS